MKRQSGAVREVDNPPRDRSERKRARLLQNSGQLNDTPSAMKGNNLTPAEPVQQENNMELVFDDINVYFGDAKTSTPLTQNGMKNGSGEPSMPGTSKPESLQTPSVSFIAGDVDRNTPPDLDAYNEGATNDISPTTASLLNISESDQSSEKLRNGTDENNCAEQASKFTSEEIMPTIDNMQDVQQNEPEVLASTSKCDVDYFLTSFMQVMVLSGHAEDVLAVAADEEIVLSASQDTTIKMWDVYQKAEICNFQGHSGAVNALKLLTVEQTATLASKMNFPEVSKIAISVSSDCSIRLWAIPSGVELLSIYTFNGITCLDYNPELHFVVIGTDGGKLEVWDVLTSKVVHSILGHQDAITGLKCEDGYIYTSSADGLVKVWFLEEDDLQIIYTRTRMVQKSEDSTSLTPCHWTCLTNYERSVYLGDTTQNVKVLNWKEGRLGMLKDRTSTEGYVTALQAKQSVMLSAVYDPEKETGAIQVWQLPNLTYCCTMFGDAGKVSSLAISETNNGILRIVSGGTKLLVWDFVCSKPAAPSDKDASFFCKELEQSGKEELTMYVELPSPSKKRDMKKASPQSWKCIVM